MTRISLSRSPDRFTHCRVGTSGGCSSGRGNELAVRNCCYVAVCLAARGASAPTGDEGGGDISWRPPAYSLLSQCCKFVLLKSSVVKDMD